MDNTNTQWREKESCQKDYYKTYYDIIVSIFKNSSDISIERLLLKVSLGESKIRRKLLGQKNIMRRTKSLLALLIRLDITKVIVVALPKREKKKRKKITISPMKRRKL